MGEDNENGKRPDDLPINNTQGESPARSMLMHNIRGAGR